MSETALSRLAGFVAEDPLKADGPTLAILRDGVIDTLGCIHAGVSTEVARRARSAVSALGAEGPAAVIGTNWRTSRPQAAFLNAVAGHALDFDDWEIPGNTHPSVVLFPAILAASDEATSGAEIVRAYLAGFEVIARLGEALNFQHYDAGWHSTATLGAVGAAAAAGRMLGLDASKMTHALSLAISSAAGYTCQFGSHAKPLQAGFAARAGVEAAYLGSAGLTAQAHVLDHPRGKGSLMGGVTAGRIAAAFEKLGGPLALSEHGLVMKPWPSCGYTHRLMTCALRMRENITPDSVEKIDLHLPDFHAQVVPFLQPNSRAEALFSLPFVVAMGLVHGRLDLSDLAEEAWKDARIKALVARSRVLPFAPKRPDLNYAEEDPDRLVVTSGTVAPWKNNACFPEVRPRRPWTTKSYGQNSAPIRVEGRGPGSCACGTGRPNPGPFRSS